MPENTNQAQRYCTNCGNEFEAGTNFCAFCGASLSGENGGRTGANTPSATEVYNPVSEFLSGLSNRRLVPYGVGALLFVILLILLVSTSVAPFFVMGLMIASLIVVLRLSAEKPLSKRNSYIFWGSLAVVVLVGLTGSGSDSTNSDDQDNADLLLTTLQAGMVNGHQAITDVEISGTQATVIVSGVSDEYAESACYFVLDAAPELHQEAKSNDYAGITEVTVKHRWIPWSAASC